MQGEYLNKVRSELSNYPNILPYFNGNTGKIVLSVNTYNSKEVLRDEIYNLISVSKDYGFGKEHWVMYVVKGKVESADKLVVQLSCVI